MLQAIINTKLGLALAVGLMHLLDVKKQATITQLKSKFKTVVTDNFNTYLFDLLFSITDLKHWNNELIINMSGLFSRHRSLQLLCLYI